MSTIARDGWPAVLWSGASPPTSARMIQWPAAASSRIWCYQLRWEQRADLWTQTSHHITLLRMLTILLLYVATVSFLGTLSLDSDCQQCEWLARASVSAYFRFWAFDADFQPDIYSIALIFGHYSGGVRPETTNSCGRMCCQCNHHEVIFLLQSKHWSNNN